MKKTYWTRVLKVVRQEWSRNNPERRECIKRAYIEGTDPKKWQCAICKNGFAMSEIQVDHVDAIERTVPTNIIDFIFSLERLHSDKLQVLCRACHKLKTKDDMMKKRYNEYVKNVATYLQISDDFLKKNIMDVNVMKKFDTTIKKIETSNNRKKYENELEKLKEIFL